jgi:hypothetical protein
VEERPSRYQKDALDGSLKYSSVQPRETMPAPDTEPVPAKPSPSLTPNASSTPAQEADLWAMERVRRRLATHEDELRRTWPSPRRTELDRMIARDIELLCRAFKRMETALERQG